MVPIGERINNPLPTRELERRWQAVRDEMERCSIDVLLMRANNDFMGGYVKYFTDLPAAYGYPVTVLFPRDDRMTLIHQGPFGLDFNLPVEDDGLRRGVKRLLNAGFYESAANTARYEGELVEKALDRFDSATIGLVGTSSIPFAVIDHLRRGKFGRATFVDASEMVDNIKAIKSDDELALIRRAAELQDAVMRGVLDAIRPGMRDIDVAALAQQAGQQLGSEQGIFLCASGPVGTPAVMASRHLQNRRIQKGDQFCLLIENNGPGGFYTELGRTCVLGKASSEMRDEFAFVLEAQKFALGLVQSGVSCKEIWAAYNEFLHENGRPIEQRLFCHSQGYDMVERPLVRFDEDMPLAPRMNLAVHPAYVTTNTYSWICDNFWLDETNACERLHNCPQEIFELN